MEKVRFDDFIKLNRGFDLPDACIEDGPYPVVASTNIKAYHKDYKVDGPAVTTGRSGSLGKVQYIEGRCWPLNTSLYVKDFKGNNPRYAYYLLQTMHLEQYNAGAGVPTLNQNHLHSLKLLVHKKNEQARIAAILSAYDKLIENNNKRIQILEKMAENLYKEWFVRFHFPGHENMSMENGLPKGWKYIIAGERYNITIGKTPPRKEFEWFASNDAYAQNWLTISDMKGMFVWDTAEQITRTAVARFNMFVLPVNTILLSFKLTVGRLAIASMPLCTNEAIAHFVNVPTIEHEYLYQQLKVFDYRKLGNTSAIGNAINSKIVKSMKLVLPTSDNLKAFHEILAPVFNNIQSLTKQNSNLARQRDLLLPRLMSGKLEVKP